MEGASGGGILFFIFLLWIFGVFDSDESRSRGITRSHDPSSGGSSGGFKSGPRRELGDASASGRTGWKDKSLTERHLERDDITEEVRRNVRPASPRDYAKWLQGYLKRGGEIRYKREREMDFDFFVATGDFELPRLCGANSMALIVPEHVDVTYSDRGHSRIMWMDEYEFEGAGVESFTDPEIQSVIQDYT